MAAADLDGQLISRLSRTPAIELRLLSGAEVKLDDLSGQSSAGLFQPDASTWADPVKADGGYGHAQISHSSGMLFWLTGLRAESVFAVMSGPGAKVELFDAVTVRTPKSPLDQVPFSEGCQIFPCSILVPSLSNYIQIMLLICSSVWYPFKLSFAVVTTKSINSQYRLLLPLPAQ